MATLPVVIEKGLNARFAQAMVAFQAARDLNPGLMNLALQAPSTAASEKYGWIGAMPAVQEWLGDLNMKSFNDYDYTIKNKDWAVPMPLPGNVLEDDQTGTISTIPEMLVNRIMQKAQSLIIELILDGETGLAYDGIAFFSDSSGARVIDNLGAGTGTTIAQISADLNLAEAAMAGFVDDQSEILNISPNVIVCPKAHENTFRRLVNSSTDPTATATGTFNPFNGRYTVIGDARLDADDANDWYLFSTTEVIKPFIYQLRKTAQPHMEKIPLTKNWVYYADMRSNAGYGIPHLAYKIINS